MQHKNKTPPAPPLRQGSTLSSANTQANNTTNSVTANDTSSISSQSQLRGFDEQSIINDQLRVFEAIEGTPLNFSTATSFSDLTVDDVDPTDGRISRDPDDGLLQIHSHKNFHRQEDTDTER